MNKPTRDELVELASEHGVSAQDIGPLTAAILTRWGRPTIQPVPVAEQLPGPDDCNDRGECYAWDGNYWWMVGGCWWGQQSDEPFTHWLPHHALPEP